MRVRKNRMRFLVCKATVVSYWARRRIGFGFGLTTFAAALLWFLIIYCQSCFLWPCTSAFSVLSVFLVACPLCGQMVLFAEEMNRTFTRKLDRR
jgi:hypothetical protein